MKNLLVAVIVFITFSCDFGNREETVAKILEQGNYAIVVSSEGCMGAGVETLEVVNNLGNTNKALYTFLDYSEPDGPHKKTKEIIWGKEKEIVLKEIFKLVSTKTLIKDFAQLSLLLNLRNFLMLLNS